MKYLENYIKFFDNYIYTNDKYHFSNDFTIKEENEIRKFAKEKDLTLGDIIGIEKKLIN